MRRSTSAPVSLSEPKTSVHLSKGRQVVLLEQADGEMMIRYHGATVHFQESSQPLSSLWGEVDPRYLESESRQVADGKANGHLNKAQRDLLAALESSHEAEVKVKKVATKGQRIPGKPVRLSLHRTPTQAQQARWEAVQQAKGQGGYPCGLSPGSWACPASPLASTPKRRTRPPNYSAPRSVPRPKLWPHH